MYRFALSFSFILLAASDCPAHLVITGSDNQLITGINNYSPYDFNGGVTVGYQFTTNTSVNVTMLGAWDAGGDGFANQIVVGLWDNSGTLLKSVTLGQGTGLTLDGEFRYADAGASLSAGETYVIGAYRQSGDPYNISSKEGVDFFVNPIFNVIESRVSFNGSGSDGALKFPGVFVAQNEAFIGPNLKFEQQVAAVPEPSSLALLGMGVISLCGYGWRRKRHQAA